MHEFKCHMPSLLLNYKQCLLTIQPSRCHWLHKQCRILNVFILKWNEKSQIDESGWPCEHNTDLCFEYVFKEEEWNGTLKFSYRCTSNFFFSAVLALKKILIHFALQLSSYVSQKVTLMSLFSLIEMDRGMKSCECRPL